MFKWLTSIVGDSNERELKRLQPLVEQTNALEPDFQALSDAQLRAKTEEFRGRLDEGEALESLLPEAFAAVREAAKRTIGQRHFDVQLMGGVVLHQGKIAEMKTGEGKTLVATLPAYLNALTGQGVHIITVNDYLAKRDPQWMGPIYDALGLSVASIQHESSYIFDSHFPSPEPRLRHLRPVSRPEAYLADVTYGTNNEFGFDYLRDNMVNDLSQCVQRPLYYAIVDEVDNILIDEARTPLIISGAAQESTQWYNTFANLVPRLRPSEDYTVDEKTRVVSLTEAGISRMEQLLNLPNLYDPSNYALTQYLDNALRAHVVYRRDRDYVVKDGQVIIVDEFTGRLMWGRRYAEGLHQAIEAKERVKIQRESITLATITFQNYFRMYEKLAGMTGTAATEAEEFFKIYKLEVVVIPTYKTMIRRDSPDLVYKAEQDKFRAVVKEIEDLYRQGRPVLVGTVSIEKSELLSEMLQRRGVPHQVLNAKYHEKEAAIVTQAGRPGMVTIATNMAGRGTDIILGGNPQGLMEELLHHRGFTLDDAPPEELERAEKEALEGWQGEHDRVVGVGGLHIIGTERHEARRIDNQLRGRSGRQGDPGSSRFYVSLDDDIMRRFGGDRIKGFMEWAGLEDDVPIEHSMVTKAIENAQVKVEGYHFDIRKHLVEYDDVMNKQREVIYAERRKILEGADLKANILDMVQNEIKGLVTRNLAGRDSEEWNLDNLVAEVKAIFPIPSGLDSQALSLMGREEIQGRLLAEAQGQYEEKETEVGAENMRVLERLLMLQVIDGRWVEHLTMMDNMREGIGLQAYGQTDPLVAYKRQGHLMFQELQETIQRDIVHTIFHVTIAREAAPRPKTAVSYNRSQGNGARELARAGKKVGRNDPCPCGSGKKYKRCHGR
ncbi:MAG: preprotein translocase subunit SecA [Chloroflexi bacterium]|nr:preprotein translocase subunit SecA [Chloroflexota bacterium]